MEINDIKKQLSILTVLNSYNIKPDKNNRVLCPFHKDKTPSMQIYPETNTYCCFSSNCTAGTGDQIQFIELYEKTTRHQAILKAISLIPGNIQPTTVTQKNNTAAPLTRSTDSGQAKIAVLTKMFSYFKNAVPGSKPAQEYLQGRTLDYTKLEVGYNSGQFHHGERTGKELIESCKQYGLLIESIKRGPSQTYTVFGKYGIVFPLKNKEHQITGLYYRSTINEDNHKHYYLKDRQGLYPSHPRPDTTKLILTESIIDAATLLQLPEISTHYTILACYGTNGLTDEHTEALNQLKNLKEIIIAFDNDDAGKASTEKYSRKLHELLPHITINTIDLPCKDVNETAQAHEPEIFTHLLQQRKNIFLSTESSIEKEKSEQQQASPLGRLEGLNTSNPDQLHYNTSELLITLLGGISLQNLDRMRVTLYIRRNPHLSAVYSIRQTIDLYHHDALEKFIRQASERLETGTTIITEAIASLTEELEQYRLNEIEKKKAVSKKKPRRQLTPEEKKQALENLQREDLLPWTMEQLLQTGIIGEKDNAGILFYGMTSRLLENPVSVITLSSTGTGKSYLLERVAMCMPEDAIIENTQLTDNSLYYFKQNELSHKVIIIEDMDGAANVEYAIRELISKKYITKTVVVKNSKGKLNTEQYRVEGPVAFFGCTTREKLYDDNANRVIIIYLNTGKAQDKAIMDYHKQVKAGLIDTKKEQQIREELQNMQYLLKPWKIINPYATLLDLPQAVFKPRRTLGILFSFIEAIALYHQYSPSQQEHKTKGYLQVQPEHIAYAFELLKETLFRKSDELSATLRNFLESLKIVLDKEKKRSFLASDIRRTLNMKPRTLRKYLSELKQYDYLNVVGGNPHRKGLEYELTPLAKEENIKTEIDKHIAAIMQKIKSSGHQSA